MGAGRPAPSPMNVTGNRWTEIKVPELDNWNPSMHLSVVVPHYDEPEALRLTLEGLNLQTYPKNLLQVIVADDGSRVVPEIPADVDVDIKVVSQEHRGFGLARARNLGASVASGPIILFLDCGLIPEPGWAKAHARWHHVVSDAGSIGYRLHVGESSPLRIESLRACVSKGTFAPVFEDMTPEPSDFVEFHLERTQQLTSHDNDLFRIVGAGNFGLHADLFEQIGGFDETFTQWGGEDIEFGYRAFLKGALFVPDRTALTWHRGRLGITHPEKARSLHEQRAKMASLIAHPGFRQRSAGRSFAVPSLLVEIPTKGQPAQDVASVVEAVLGSDFHDLLVYITLEEDVYGDRVWLERYFSGDSRVRLGPKTDLVSEYDRVPIHLELPPFVRVGPSSISDIVARLEDPRVPRGLLHVVLPGIPPEDGMAIAFTSRAWHRAARLTGKGELEKTMGGLFGEEWIAGRDLGFSPLEESEIPVQTSVHQTSQSDMIRLQRQVMALNPVQRTVIFKLAWRLLKLIDAIRTLLRARDRPTLGLGIKRAAVALLPRLVVELLRPNRRPDRPG